MNNGRPIPEFGAFEMGLQVSYRVCPEAAPAPIVWPDPPPVGRDFPCVGPPERVSDCRGASVARSCPHLYRDSAQTCGGTGDWLFERQECYSHRAAVWWQGAELHRRAFLGPRLRRVHGGLRAGPGASLHPCPRGRRPGRHGIILSCPAWLSIVTNSGDRL